MSRMCRVHASTSEQMIPISEVNEMSTELEEKLKSSLVDDELSYAIALKISQQLGVSLREIAETAGELGIKLSNVQYPGGWW